MKPIKAKTNFILNGVYYEKNDEVIIDNKADLVRLNEKGYIEPLTPKEIQNFGKKEIPKKNIFKKEEE